MATAAAPGTAAGRTAITITTCPGGAAQCGKAPGRPDVQRLDRGSAGGLPDRGQRPVQSDAADLTAIKTLGSTDGRSTVSFSSPRSTTSSWPSRGQDGTTASPGCRWSPIEAILRDVEHRRGRRLLGGADPDGLARHGVRPAVAAAVAPGRGDRDPGHRAAAGQRRGHAARPGPRRQPPDRGRPGRRGVQPDARPRRGRAGPPGRQRGPAAPLRRRRQPRTAHPAGRHPRLRRARAAPPRPGPRRHRARPAAGRSRNQNG